MLSLSKHFRLKSTILVYGLNIDFSTVFCVIDKELIKLLYILNIRLNTPFFTFILRFKKILFKV